LIKFFSHGTFVPLSQNMINLLELHLIKRKITDAESF